MTVQAPVWSSKEMVALLEAMARSADRNTLSFTETAHIARSAADVIRYLADEIERFRKALEEINSDIEPEIKSSELELIVWWGQQVDRLQAIARDALGRVEGTNLAPDHDRIALDAAHKIEALPSDLHQVQRTARIQCLVLDALSAVTSTPGRAIEKTGAS